MSPLKHFMLGALLWLPLAFFLWFWFAAPLVWPVIEIARLVLVKAWPSLFTAVSQGADLLDAQGHVLAHAGYLMQLSSGVLVNAAPAGEAPRFGFLEPVVNPMVYGYSLPLFAGLVLATPLTRRQRATQLAVGIVLIWLAQAFGVIAESLKSLGMDAGPAGAEAVQRAGLPLELIALCYQFGYLILPALVPAALWIVGNRPFIEMLTRPSCREPVQVAGVETQGPGGN
ncbi:MAG: hypothetical protein P4L92_19695 [Rudaea sp.]|nr:hypothetical protein [Rudaea sp.]